MTEYQIWWTHLTHNVRCLETESQPVTCNHVGNYKQYNLVKKKKKNLKINNNKVLKDLSVEAECRSYILQKTAVLASA